MKQHFLLLGRGYAHFRSGTLTQIIYMRVKDVKDAAIRQLSWHQCQFKQRFFLHSSENRRCE